MVAEVRGASAARVGKNKIINGNFDIWQRGTSFVSPNNNTYTADRWAYSLVGSSLAHTVIQDSDVPTVAESGVKSNYSLKVDCTTAKGSLAADDLVWIVHRLEGYTWKHIVQKKFTISFWVKATKTGTYCVACRSSTKTYIAEYTVSGSGWEKKTITVDASPDTGSFDTAYGIEVHFVLAAGANLQNTADSWLTANDVATSNQVNACDSDSNDFRLAQVQIEEGGAATPFEERLFGTEMELCQRYFLAYKFDDQAAGTWGYGPLGIRSGGADIYADLYFPTRMRTNPTFSTDLTAWTTGAPGLTQVSWLNAVLGTYATISGSPNFIALGLNRTRCLFRVNADTSFSGTTGDAGYFLIGADGLLYFDAEL